MTIYLYLIIGMYNITFNVQKFIFTVTTFTIIIFRSQLQSGVYSIIIKWGKKWIQAIYTL